jgi:hypothetical protein
MCGGWVNISVIRHSSIVPGEVCEITSDEPHDPQWDPQHKQQAVCLVRLSSALLGFGCVGSAPAGFAWLASAAGRPRPAQLVLFQLICSALSPAPCCLMAATILCNFSGQLSAVNRNHQISVPAWLCCAVKRNDCFSLQP